MEESFWLRETADEINAQMPCFCGYVFFIGAMTFFNGTRGEQSYS